MKDENDGVTQQLKSYIGYARISTPDQKKLYKKLDAQKFSQI